MKFIRSLVLCAIAFVAASVATPASAQVIPGRAAYSTGGTAVGTTLSYAIISSYSFNGGTPVVTYLSGTSDKAGSKFLFYNCTTNTGVTGANTTVTIPVSQTNGFASGDIIIIQHVATDTYERRILTTFTATNSVVVTVAPTTATVAGDRIWDVSAAGSIPVGNATKEIVTSSGLGGVYAGQPGCPLLIDLDLTSAGQINAATAAYLPNR